MRLKVLSLTAFVLALGFVQTAAASPGLNYNYVEGAFKWVHLDSQDENDALGLTTLASWSPIENFFVEGGYEYLNVALPGPANVDDNTFRYGVGGYFPLQETLHLVGRVGGLHTNLHLNKNGEEIDVSPSSNDDGVYAGAALRYELTEEIELEPAAEYDNIGGSASWIYSLTGLYAFDDRWQGLAEAGINDDSDVELSAGVRYNWGCAEVK